MMSVSLQLLFFFFNDTATTEIYTLSLHDALPIFHQDQLRLEHHRSRQRHTLALAARKLVDVASFVAAQLDHRERIGHLLRPACFRLATGAPRKRPALAPRHVRKESVVLKHKPHLA